MTLRETRGENRWESFGLWVACRRFWGQPSSAAEPFVKATSGKNFSARFSAGFSVKFINDKLADTRAGAFAVDFGTNFHATIGERDRKSTRLNSSHGYISYAVFCLKKKKNHQPDFTRLTT